jgi:predicted Zn-dependent protease
MKRERVILWVIFAFAVGFVAGSTLTILKGKKDEKRSPIALTAPSPIAIAPASIEDTEKIEALKEDLRQNPNDHRLWLRLGNKYGENGQISLAVDALRHYLALEPRDAKVWTSLGSLLERSGDVEGAAEAFKKATEDGLQKGRDGP